jgi:hypothetical protein
MSAGSGNRGTGKGKRGKRRRRQSSDAERSNRVAIVAAIIGALGLVLAAMATAVITLILGSGSGTPSGTLPDPSSSAARSDAPPSAVSPDAPPSTASQDVPPSTAKRSRIRHAPPPTGAAGDLPITYQVPLHSLYGIPLIQDKNEPPSWGATGKDLYRWSSFIQSEDGGSLAPLSGPRSFNACKNDTQFVNSINTSDISSFCFKAEGGGIVAAIEVEPPFPDYKKNPPGPLHFLITVWKDS